MEKEFILDKVEKVTYLTPSSPVVLVSTTSKDGVNNLAPFAMFMVASTRPNMIIVAINDKSDTHKNIINTHEFVVGIPKMGIESALYASGEKFPPNVDEFEKVGFTAYKSRRVVPAKIAECIANLECKLAWYRDAGNHTIFCGRVVDADIDKGIYEDGITNADLRKRISQLYHISSNAFLSAGEVIYVDKD